MTDPSNDTMLLLPSLALDDLLSEPSPSKTEATLSVGITSSPSLSAPSSVVSRQRSGPRRALTQEESRHRRLARERLRMRAVKDRIEELRRDLAALTITRDEAIRRREQLPQQLPELLRCYLPLVRGSDQLYGLQLTQEETLLRRFMETTAVELLAEGAYRFRLAVPSATVGEVVRRTSDGGSDQLLMDPIALFESLVKDEPLTAREAQAFVSDSCREMAHSLAQPDWVHGFKEFGGGLTGGRRIAGPLLEFRLVKRLPNVTPHELMEKTWTLLTKLEEYQRIQPQTTQLRVLQRVSPASWVVGLSVGKRRALTLVSRAIVHGGYVVTFRSLPLARKEAVAASETEFARQRFVESETGGLYVQTFSWYNFTSSGSNNTDCNVVFGGTARNIHPEYLKQLQLEVVAGFARWQAAVGFPHVLFMAPLEETP